MTAPSEALAAGAPTTSPFVPRPASGPWDVTTLLLDFSIITYAVPPEALARHLPPDFEPDTFVLADGRRVAFVSAVPFRDEEFRFGFAPFLRARMGQTNYRAYVRYRGERAVWFFGTSLDSFWVGVPRSLWKLPWHPARMRFQNALVRRGRALRALPPRHRGRMGPGGAGARGKPDAHGVPGRLP
ncbi:DUF2071 domain-containing protein [Archangium gephyra]|uniref:DUF2071 domain-containing protein n=1 Tax=Archangium gephyra TaxID=48 RepID=UPI003B7BDF18